MKTLSPRELFAPEHEELRAAVRTYVERELVPHAEKWERAESFPRDVFERMGDLGFLGMKFAAEVGGSGPDYLADAVVTEELARCGSGGVAACIGAHKDLACLYVGNFGNSEQHRRWLAPALEGKSIGALAVTEPDAGSDVAGIKCVARRDGNSWVLNGSKMFITNGAWADFVVVVAKTDANAEPPYSGITLFVVDKETPGFSARRMRMLGWRTGQTGELFLSDVRVDDSCRLGDEGSGFAAIMHNFVWERLVMALGAVSGAQRTYELAKSYALDREAFGRPVGKFQIWRHRFADLITRIEAARALTYAALRSFVAGESSIGEAAMAKLYATELAAKVADECVQVHGGYGYMMEFPAQRALRDARLGPIGGGTSQIMREIIGRTLGL
ncbi:MAG: acyl-CoA dehydrogenase family protein [Actinomycetota bacterium]